MHMRHLAYERSEESLDDLVESEWVTHHFDKDTAEYVMSEIKAAKESIAHRANYRKDLSKFKAVPIPHSASPPQLATPPLV
eukprot:7915717-Pyramimonas_sp.AAC.1